MIRIFLLMISALGSILFGAAFLISFLKPTYIEEVGKDIIKREVEVRVDEKIGSVPKRLIYIISACKKGHTMASNIVYCPRCNSDRIYRHGKSAAGHARYRCPACPHVFQLTYTYEACKPGVKEKIVEMAFNSAGVRDTARVLKISKNTVTSVLKNSAQSKSPLKR